MLNGAADFHHLLAGGAEFIHSPAGLEREVVIFDDALSALHHLAAIYPAQRQPRLASQENVFGDGEVRGQHGFLMNHRNALERRLRGTAKADAAALPKHFPAVAFQHAGHDFHERGFAGAVFAHQQMDLTARRRRDWRRAGPPHRRSVSGRILVVATWVVTWARAVQALKTNLQS